MRWSILLFGALAACTATPDPPAADGGPAPDAVADAVADAAQDAVAPDATAADRAGSDAFAIDHLARVDGATADSSAADAAIEDAGFGPCVFDYDRLTLRAINERRWLNSGGAPVSAATSSAQHLVEATVEQGSAVVRALAAGSAEISMTSSTGTVSTTVEVDLTDSVFATAVTAVSYGTGAGFGQASMPGIVLGPPLGSGPYAGSLDVVSLGLGGSITVELGVDVVDGPGTDLIVFENPFEGFIEIGQVEVSTDGINFVAFACDAATTAGCAGVQPVNASSANSIDPTDPAAAGGDAFDLAAISVTRAHYVRVTDVGGFDTGGGKAGFDLDAVVAVHSVARSATALTAPPARALAIGQSSAPSFDVSASGRTQYAVPVACSAEPAAVLDLRCGCSMTGRSAGTAIVTARFGDLTQQLTVTVNE